MPPKHSQTSAVKPEPKNAVVVHQLLTPEEPSMDSFSNNTLPPLREAVPPSTPDTPAFRNFSAAAEQDDALYPDHDVVEGANEPLFEKSPSKRDSLSPKPSAKPRNVRSICEMVIDNPVKYYQMIMAQNDAMRETHRLSRMLPPLTGSVSSAAQRRDSFTSKQLSKFTRSQKPKPKPKASPKLIINVKPKVTAVTAASPAGISKRQRRSKAKTPDALSVSPESKPRTRAPATKKKEGPSADEWYQVPDYCPPASSLNSTKTLVQKAFEKSSAPSRPLDLSNDPNRNHLDQQEIDLASALRLPCNQYLLCKRTIFAAKVQALRDGNKIFNKTAAQNVCGIDVNKVSKLHSAFEGVGWFDESLFDNYLSA